MQRTAFEEDRGANARPVVEGETLYVENDSGGYSHDAANPFAKIWF
jgi:hypothetical protein